MKTSGSLPPRLFHRFFRWYCNPRWLDRIDGDLLESYGRWVGKYGKRKADLKFIGEVILLFRKGIIKPSEGYKSLNTYGMYKSYFKIGWRNLVKNKGYSSLNIIGLATGMAVVILIGLWVHDELSYNTHFKNYDRIVQVMKAGHFEGKYYQGQNYLPYPLIEELQNNYAQNFKHIVPVSGFDGILSTGDKHLSRTGMYIGEGGPEMFSFDMIYGTWKGLSDLHSIIISESTSKALFGDVDPLGKALKVNNKDEVTVTGVFKDFPRNTQLYGRQFFEPWSFNLVNNPWIKQQDWANHFVWAYAEIAPDKTIAQVQAQVKKAEMKAIEHLDYMKDELKFDYDVLLNPMSKWHLYSNYKDGQPQSGPIQMVRFIGAIGVFVLILACINFMNLSTARSEKRSKEVGIRKTLGSFRRQLVGQFFSESFLVVWIAFVIALLIAYVTLPWFNQLSDKQISLPMDQYWFWLSSFAFIFLTGSLAGSYPAVYLSSFNPIAVLKGGFRAGRFSSAPRKVLVVFQFSVSVMLIVCTLAIYQQLVYVKNRPVGYTREGLLAIGKKSDEFNTKGEALRGELKKTGAVTEIAESGGDLTSTWSGNGGFNWQGKDPSFEANFSTLNVSPGFGTTVGWQFIDGRDFSKDIASDSSAFIINEAALDYMKIKNPVGKTVHWTCRAWGADQDFHIVGVIKNMVMNSPFERVEPAIFMTYGYEHVLLLRMAPGMSASEALPKIEKAFQQVIPNMPFDYAFVDQQFESKFSSEERIGKLAAILAVLAIIISCLGLFGLASFVAEQRTKEIGIRKVMGASTISLWRMLSQEFFWLVVISSIVAIPISYNLLSDGLKPYEYKTEIGWWIFGLASGGSLIITLGTISFQAIKAALANPVVSLRTE
jgi:putative ABC transport system permease protein